MIKYDDNRDFYRMMINTQVTVTVGDEVNSPIATVCRDLSATGMAIEMPNPVTLEMPVRVYVDATGNTIPSLDVKGVVVRCTKENEECYVLGINILKLD